MATNVRDPRSIITPDAFELSKELLGTPLARPSRRLWAMLIDLAVIGILTAVTASITLILWGAVALFFISMAFRSPGRSLGQVGSILFRGATGCLGTVILIGVLIGYLVVRSSDDPGESLAEVAELLEAEGDTETGEISLSTIVGGLAGLADLSSAEDADEAVAAATRVFTTAAAEESFDAEAARSIFDEVVPDDAPWAAAGDSVFETALEAAGMAPMAIGETEMGDGESAEAELAAATGESNEEPSPVEAGVTGSDEESEAAAAEDRLEAAAAEDRLESAAERVAELSAPEALALFLDLDEAASEEALDDADALTLELLEARLVSTVASDSIETLEEEVDDARRDAARAERRAREAEEELASGEGGFGGLLRDIWDQAGSAIGLWSLYFTMALTLTGGRTVGKKMMGLRVVRLDGEPLTWWSSFERAGGYVAGIATGTLGFVQVFWDSNRQCVHDKIVGTVVVVDGAEIEPGAWQEAWAAQRGVQ